MDYHVLIEDFARRTRSNLQALRCLQESGVEVFEVTALVNSMLGLLIFPQQSYVDRLPEGSLEELAREGWPIPKIEGAYPQVPSLKQLVRHLRSARRKRSPDQQDASAARIAPSGQGCVAQAARARRCRIARRSNRRLKRY